MKFGVVQFPGSNCDQDAYYAVRDVLRQPVEYIWHQSTDVSSFDCIILPGGFSYGDYLRTGAVAKFSPVMNAVQEFAGKWRQVDRDMQWVPDPLRIGTAAGGADTRPVASLSAAESAAE